MPQASFTWIRGNVPTRLQRVKEGELRGEPLHGTVLAAAGLKRLGLDLTGLTVRPFQADELLPAPAQGALLAETRAENVELIAALAGFHHPMTLECVTLERAVLAGIGGGCQQPLGALATPLADGGFRLEAAYAVDGSIRSGRAEGRDQAALVAEVLRGLGL
jgi:hydroxymethylbilane synthase